MLEVTDQVYNIKIGKWRWGICKLILYIYINIYNIGVYCNKLIIDCEIRIIT